MQDETPQGGRDRVFIRRTLIVLALAGLFFLLWQLRSLLLLIFGAILVAVILRSIARPMRRYAGVPDGWAVAAAVLLVTLILAAASWMFGAQLSAQIQSLTETLPDAWNSFEQRVGDADLGEQLEQWIEDAAPSGSGVLASVSRFALTFMGGLADLIVVIVGGIFLAAQPDLYRRGAIAMVPPHRRALANEALDESGHALRQWLKAQLISMSVIGTMVGIGLWLLGVPSAFALGLLAGLLEFIPLAGPFLAALPAVLIALAVSPETALWTIALYLVVQQIEGNLLQPIVQQYAVELPAVILLFALLAFGTMFGVPGIVLAAPLAVVLFVLVRRLYVKEALDTQMEAPAGSEN